MLKAGDLVVVHVKKTNKNEPRHGQIMHKALSDTEIPKFLYVEEGTVLFVLDGVAFYDVFDDMLIKVLHPEHGIIVCKIDCVKLIDTQQ